MIDGPHWWQPEAHAERRPMLLARGRIVGAIRRHFEAEGFVEVETGALQVSPGNETHLHGFATEFREPGAAARGLYLHTSPEFAMKKLLAAGEERIFSFARVFRDRERSASHAPEFTMLEWYRAREPYERLMQDCRTLVALAAEAAGVATFRFRSASADPRDEPERLTVREAFNRYAGFDIEATLPRGPDEPADREEMGARAEEIGVRVTSDDTWSDIFSKVMADRIEPRLGMGRPTILHDYPASEAALARRKPDDPRYAERFELYVCGVELANAFGELTDPAEQRRRFEVDMAEKQRIYGETYPLDEELLAALAIMPPASGIALGLDRLAMLATGASRIEQVLWTPFPSPAGRAP